MPPKRTSKYKRKGGKPAFTKDDLGGVDPELMMSIVSKIPPNRITGGVELVDIMNYMSENPSEMEGMMAQMNLDDGPTEDELSKYDYASLASTIVDKSFWVIQMDNMGLVDKSDNDVDPADAGKEGVVSSFMIYCYTGDQAIRVTHNNIGIPGAKEVLETLQRAIVKPIPPLQPCLPWLLTVSIKFKPYKDTIMPFLNSLPKPFGWKFESPDEADEIAQGIYKKNRDYFDAGMELSEKLKKKGNAAYAKRDRATAEKAYTEAVEYFTAILTLGMEDEKKAERQLAIIYANRAACRMLPGDGIDIKGALEDGELSEKTDPSYNKSYIRQVAAYEAMDKLDEAQDALVRALRRRELENDTGLVDRLIALQTDGKGLSDDETEFKDWMLDITINDKKSSERIAGLKGEWRRRCEAHMAKFKR